MSHKEDIINRVRGTLLDPNPNRYGFHERDERGVWEIKGEDSNPDLGGSHHMPHLATVEGTYEDAVEYALGIPRFITWGGGGNIRKLEEKPEVINLDSLDWLSEQKKELRLKQLQKELEVAEDALKQAEIHKLECAENVRRLTDILNNF